eukprot:1435804-Pyramimonas_sp.AAC.1
MTETAGEVVPRPRANPKANPKGKAKGKAKAKASPANSLKNAIKSGQDTFALYSMATMEARTSAFKS